MLLSTEPEPSDDDELDTEDGENTPGSSAGTTQRARDGRTEDIRDFPMSAPPTFSSLSTNAVVGDNSRSQMKRKELEPLFTSKKRTRYVPTATSDQDDVMVIDPDERTNFKRVMGINNKPPGIFLVYLYDRHVLICLLRTENHGWIRWQATWSLSVCFFE